MQLKDPILIAGAARSGTSLVAGIIHRHGTVSGELGKLGDQWNPTGYYENYEIIDKVDKRLLRDAGYDVMGQYPLPREPLPAEDIRERVEKIAMEQGIRPGDNWYFKDAKLLLVYKSYLKSFPSSKIILVRRDGNDIIQSCMRTPFMTKRETSDQWIDWLEDHERFMGYLKSESSNVVEIWYEDLQAGNYTGISNVIKWLGFEFDKEIINNIIIKR
ncbi:sulfotransferase [bacterium]|nr:sulfotransferase [bacterium]